MYVIVHDKHGNSVENTDYQINEGLSPKKLLPAYNDNKRAKLLQSFLTTGERFQSENNTGDIDIAIITAIEDEYKALLQVFPGANNPVYRNGASCFRRFQTMNKKKKGKELSLGLFQQEDMGMVQAAILVSRIIFKHKPKFLAMCGVCAAVKRDKIQLGDAAVFSPVYDYGVGKYTEGLFSPSYRQREVDKTTKKILDTMVHDKTLLRNIKDKVECDSKPTGELQAHIMVSASGASVLADQKHIKEILKYQRDLGAIDMEAYAIAKAAYLADEEKEYPWIVVKGIQDYADVEKDDTYRKYAALISAEFLRCFFDEYFNQDVNL